MHWQQVILFFQDATAGICIRFTSTPNYTLGTQVDLNVGGLSLSEYNGWLQINNAAAGTIISGLPSITPTEITLADATANFEKYESMLIKVVNVTINNGTATTYGASSGKLTISDGTTPNSIVFTPEVQQPLQVQDTYNTCKYITGILTQFNLINNFKSEISVMYNNY
ncbi:MAG: DUF5689 domain-containing protein [Bacteroidia bacterium]